MWKVMSAHETPLLRRLRSENLAGLSAGRWRWGRAPVPLPCVLSEDRGGGRRLEPETRLADRARSGSPVRWCRCGSSSPPSKRCLAAIGSTRWCAGAVLGAGSRKPCSNQSTARRAVAVEHVASAGWRGSVADWPTRPCGRGSPNCPPTATPSGRSPARASVDAGATSGPSGLGADAGLEVAVTAGEAGLTAAGTSSGMPPQQGRQGRRRAAQRHRDRAGQRWVRRPR